MQDGAANPKNYVTVLFKGDVAQPQRPLHRVVLGLPERKDELNIVGDHINGYPMDNRRRNLRPNNLNRAIGRSLVRRGGQRRHPPVWASASRPALGSAILCGGPQARARVSGLRR